MSQPFTVIESAFYDDNTIVDQLGLSYGALEKARRTGQLRFSRRGGRILYLGRWLTEWLAGDVAPVMEAVACA